ncbi:hypothetical protein [Tardiphaga sp. 768_D3_N2_1]|uniref:hypothetical protein n=1 Tax=Tardiphaga sp. 768_D3_N2_1 TaxID=3240783 RepID=UPI003F89E27F
MADQITEDCQADAAEGDQDDARYIGETEHHQQHDDIKCRDGDLECAESVERENARGKDGRCNRHGQL